MSEDWDDEGGEQGELVREWELRVAIEKVWIKAKKRLFNKALIQASALADRMDLPKKQVMLVQCEALVEQSAADANKPETHAKPDEAHQLTSEAFAKPFTAAELKTRMVSAKSSLLQMGLNIKHRQDMQLRLDSHVEDHKHHSG